MDHKEQVPDMALIKSLVEASIKLPKCVIQDDERMQHAAMYLRACLNEEKRKAIPFGFDQAHQNQHSLHSLCEPEKNLNLNSPDRKSANQKSLKSFTSERAG